MNQERGGAGRSSSVSVEALGRSALFGALAELWRIGSRFLLTPIVLAAIGLSGYGTWTLLFSVVAYVSMAHASFGVAYTKLTAECVRTDDYERLARVLGAGVLAAAGIGLLGLAAVWFLGPPILAALNVPPELRDDARTALLVVMSVLVGRMTLGCTLEVLAGVQRIDVAHRLHVLAGVFEFAVTVPLLLRGQGLLGMAAGYALGQVAMYGLAWRSLRRVAPRIHVSPARATLAGMREIIGLGGRFQALAVLNTIMFEGVKFFLSVLIDPGATALYELANKLVSLGRALSGAIIAPLLPAFADLQAGADRIREQQLFVRASKVLALVSAAAFGFLTVLAGPLMFAWTGQEVALAVWAVQLLAPAEVLTQQTGVVSASLRARGIVRMEAAYALVATVTLALMVASLAAIAPFQGVVWARVASEVVGVGWYLRAFFGFSGMAVAHWWSAGRFGRVIAVGAAAAGCVALGRSLLPDLPISAVAERWQAVGEVFTWSVPYLALFGLGAWKIALDDEERGLLRGLLQSRLQRGADL